MGYWFRIGDFELLVVSDGVIRQDAGATFGLVPRLMWEKYVPDIDEKYRLPVGLNSLLIRGGGKTVLVDTGCGDKVSRAPGAMGIEHTGALIGNLRAEGVAPEDVDLVINSHLHFDHCGGNTFVDDGKLRPAFPRARYVIQKGEWDAATHPNDRTRGTYLAEHIDPLDEAGQVDLVDGDTAVVPGVPFALSVAHSTAGAGDYVLTNDGSGSSVKSEGPEDLDVDGSGNYASSNWVISNGATSVKPATGDTARFNTGSFDAKYGLNQSGVALDEFRRTPGYKGVIGDPVKSLFLRYGVANANDKAVTINSVVGDTWLHVTTDDIFVIALPRSANALRLKGDVGNINVNGSAVQGTITCADAMVLDNFFADECQAMVTKIGAVTSLEKVHVGSGHVTLDMGSGSIVTGVQVWGNATVIHKGLTGATVALWEGFGGLSEYNGEGTLTLLEWHTGTFSLENSTADTVAIDGTNQRGGIVTDEGGAVNVVWSSFIRFGGGGSVSATLNQFK